MKRLLLAAAVALGLAPLPVQAHCHSYAKAVNGLRMHGWPEIGEGGKDKVEKTIAVLRRKPAYGITLPQITRDDEPPADADHTAFFMRHPGDGVVLWERNGCLVDITRIVPAGAFTMTPEKFALLGGGW